MIVQKLFYFLQAHDIYISDQHPQHKIEACIFVQVFYSILFIGTSVSKYRQTTLSMFYKQFLQITLQQNKMQSRQCCILVQKRS